MGFRFRVRAAPSAHAFFGDFDFDGVDNNGDDDIRGGGGNDTIFGGRGKRLPPRQRRRDTIFDGNDGDNMTGGGGTDTCDGQGSLLDVAPGASCETLLNVP